MRLVKFTSINDSLVYINPEHVSWVAWNMDSSRTLIGLVGSQEGDYFRVKEPIDAVIDAIGASS